MSRHLSERQIRGLQKIGDRVLPGDGELASFSELGCVREVDRILDHMPRSDLRGLKLLLMIAWVAPAFVVAWFLRLLEKSPRMSHRIGAPLRFVRLGIRGLVMTLYYSHPCVHQALGYQVGVYTADLRHSVPAAGLSSPSRRGSEEAPSQSSVGFRPSDNRMV